MAADTHHERGGAHAEPAARPSPRYTHELTMTTREKCLLTAPYAVVFEVEQGACTLDVVDTMQAWVVAGDKPGDARVSVTPQEPHEDYVPALILCHVASPLTEVTMGATEPK